MESFSTIDLVLNNYRASLSLGDYNVQVLAKLSTHDIMRVADRFKSMPSLKYSATLFGHRALFRHRHRTKAIGGTNKKCTDFGKKTEIIASIGPSASIGNQMLKIAKQFQTNVMHYSGISLE